MTKIYQHPFKEGILWLLAKHFEPGIVKKFILEFEVNTFNADKNINIRNQIKDQNYVLEVYYRKPDETKQYICDVYSWESRSATEHHLLRFITDCVRAGKIGSDWVEKGGRIGVSDDIRSGKYESKDE